MLRRESNKYFRKSYLGDEMFGLLRGPLAFAFRSLDFLTIASAYHYPVHKHKSYEFILPVEGDYSCVLEGQRLQVKPGEFILSQPGDQHEDFYQGDSSFFGLLFFLRTPDKALWKYRLLSEKCPLTLRKGSMSPDSKELFASLVRLFSGAADKSFQDSSLIRSLCETLFWSILSSLPEDRFSEPFRNCSQEERFRRESIEYFRSEVGQDFSVRKMAAHFGMSVRSLDYRFKAVLGVSPAKAFSSFRVGEALVLMEAGHTVKEAAETLGFSDPFHLSKTFKRQFGFSPSSLRKRG